MIKLFIVAMYMFAISSNANPHGYLKSELPQGFFDSSSSSDNGPYYYHGQHLPRWWKTVNDKRWFPIKEYRGGLMEV
ncbi:hypothetical protein EWB00_007748 [Schistosoma japonicum]|uniref:Hypotheticial protein n=1 Tax=Schistosoma japonicum TaxID=6182 RepID=C1LGR8_SCHJA|nr:hypothetical protein KSF78_0007709 [Schistosoma japonicum]TNN07400.1 hypothetical protein EWB00_007748 [Schistosoma japonicum]CAX73896.1 hypotheticial protein [Schistosoma japonicum]